MCLLCLLWFLHFFRIRTLADKCRDDESEKPPKVGESTFASTNRGLYRLNRFVTPTRNAIRFPLPNGIGSSFSMLAFVAIYIGIVWLL